MTRFGSAALAASLTFIGSVLLLSGTAAAYDGAPGAAVTAVAGDDTNSTGWD